MKIHLTKSAVGDLHDIDSYIRQDNLDAANRTVLSVLEAIEYLGTYPTMGRAGRVPKTRELVVSGTPFIIIYQVRRSTIMILRILHTARKWPTH